MGIPFRASPNPRPISVALKVPVPLKIDWANCPANSSCTLSDGACFPLNRPVVGSMVGSVAPWLTLTPRPSNDWVKVAVAWTLAAGACGVIDLVFLGDSMLDGPDWMELMSKAVTE